MAISMGTPFDNNKVTMWLVIVVSIVVSAHGHGYLEQPVARSSAWRKGLTWPANYDDNGLNCGGYGNQFGVNGGKCGLCGDPYQDPQPRANEGGGKYGGGVIVASYKQGATIDVKVIITANHQGTFTFQLCPTNNPTKPANETCFNNHQLQLSNGDRFYVLGPDTSVVNLKVKLPDDMTCPHGCVFRWKWRAGNNWGCEDGFCGLGSGPQEHFFGCSDIAITSRDDPPPRKSTTVSHMRSTQRRFFDAHASTPRVSMTKEPNRYPPIPKRPKTRPNFLNFLRWCQKNCLYHESGAISYGVEIFCDCSYIKTVYGL